jgi:PAS domain S-box-containing protein
MEIDRGSRVTFLITDRKVAGDFTNHLNSGGIEVDIVADLSSALRAARRSDVVIADISYGPDGPALCRSFRTDRSTKDIPLLAFSREELDDERIGNLLSAGAMDVLTPPISPPLLLARVRNLVLIHQEELHLKEMEMRYKRIFSSSHYGYFLSTREGRFLEVNDALLNILGYSSREEVLDLKLPDDLYVNPSDRELLQNLIEKKGFVRDFKVDFKRKDGSKITILLTANIYRGSDGNTIGYEGFNIPLTNLDLPIPMRFLYRLFKPFRRYLSKKPNFMSVSRISELVANQYEKVEELSEGLHTSVWKGRDVLGFEEGPLVLKISKSEAVNPRLLTEAKVLRKLQDHPGVPQLVDIARDRDRTVVVTRYVEGSPLSDLISSLDDKNRDRIAYQLMDITAHLHDNHIVHRDIKPDNIVIEPDGRLTLLDYGIVRRMSEQETSSTIIGTRPYMSPEQVNGRSERRSDVWALGVVLYYMYTGSMPFTGNTEMELMETIMKREPPSPRSLKPDLPYQMEQVLFKALRKRPEGRFHSAGEMRDTVLNTIPGFRENVVDLISQPEVAPVLVP